MSKRVEISIRQINEYYVNAPNNLKQAAKLVGCSVITFARCMETYGIPRKERTWNAENFYTKHYATKKKVISIEDIQKHYFDKSYNMFEAAKEIGCSVACLRRSIKEQGFNTKPKSWNRERTRKIDILNNKEWLMEQLKTKSLNQIAREVGATYGNAGYYSKKHGLSVPNKQKSEAVKAGLRKAFPDGRAGINASNWQGGTRYTGKNRAYIMQWAPDHPNATKDGYVMEHRLIMETHLGRYLTREEIVHHKNGIKHDNRIENLELAPDRGTHTREHFERSHITEQALTEKQTLEARIKELEEENKKLKSV